MVPIPSSNGGANNSGGPDSNASVTIPASISTGGAANTASTPAPTQAPNVDMRAMVADLERQIQLLNAQL